MPTNIDTSDRNHHVSSPHSDTNKTATDVANETPTMNQPNAVRRAFLLRAILSDFRVG